MLKLCLYVLVLSAMLVSGGAQASRSQLTVDQLLSDLPIDHPVNLVAFSPVEAVEAVNQFQGRLIFGGDKTSALIKYYRDDYNFSANLQLNVSQLPVIDIRLLQSGDDLIPLQRHPVINAHPHWEYMVGPGKVWQENGDKGFSRASIPFSLRERNANCTHNGLLSFLFKAGGEVSDVYFQVSSETCMYFKFDLSGTTKAVYKPELIADSDSIVANYKDEVISRLPVKSLKQLAQKYPVIKLSDLNVIDPVDMTVYGFVIDGVNYVSDCNTRHGVYPYCEVLALPSYSLAKSIFAALALMYLENKYTGIRHQRVADYVTECNEDERWRDVTFENLIDMATGNYQSAKDSEDEWSEAMDDDFFIPERHAEKIDYACNAMQRQSEPGSRWVYHTTDTYILGAALNQFIKNKEGPNADLFQDVFLSVWWDQQLSPVTKHTMRSYDEKNQPFTGFGLTLHYDDIAKMALALVDRGSDIYSKVSISMLDAAMQRLPADRGLPAATSDYRYQHGFWAKNLADYLGCKQELWIPFMTGYGGINVVMMPNDTVYYYFSDGGKFSWQQAAKISNNIRRYCY